MIQLGALRKAMDKDIEMGMSRVRPITVGQCAAALYLAVFVDGPMVLQPVDLDGFTSSALGASEVTVATSDPALTPRAWYKANPDRTVATGLEDSLQMLKDVLSRDYYVVSLYPCLLVHKMRAPLLSGCFRFQVGCGRITTGFILIISFRSAKVQQLQPFWLHWCVGLGWLTRETNTPGFAARETTYIPHFLSGWQPTYDFR